VDDAVCGANSIEDALHACIKIAQQELYAQEISDLSKKGQVSSKSQLQPLHPFLDKEGYLRVGGRLQHSHLPYDSKHQLILPPAHHITELIIMNEHLRLLHAGPQILSASLRQQYWIPRMKQVICPVLHRCLPCFKLKAASSQQMMGQLPLARVTVSRPFVNAGIDYVGPFEIKSGNKTVKQDVRSTMYTHCSCMQVPLFTLLRQTQTQQVYSQNMLKFVGKCKAIPPYFLYDDLRGEILVLYSSKYTTCFNTDVHILFLMFR
jgi:hypothetical protein